MANQTSILLSFQTIIFIIQLLSFCIYVTAEDDYQGYNYEVQVEPLKYASQVPTGGYTFLGFGKKKASRNYGKEVGLDEKATTEIKLGLNPVPETSPGNRYILDLALVLDSSYTITSAGWTKIKEAAKKLIDGLDISPDGTHVSIMKFSTDVEAYYMFDANTGKERLKKQIGDLKYDGEWSRLDMALQAVDHHVFIPVGGARLGTVPRALVIFSDGKADGPSSPDEEINWQQRIVEPLNSLKNKNVQVFSVSAGVPDQAALEAITGNPARVFDMNSIDDLVVNIEDVSQKIPFEPAPPPPLTVTVTVTAYVEPTVSTTPSLAVEGTSTTVTPSLVVDGTRTVTTTEVVTMVVTTTPIATVVATETKTAMVNATETARTMVTATKTDTMTETVTAVDTESLTTTAIDTSTALFTTTATDTQVVTLTTTLGVTLTTYASAVETPIPITLMAKVAAKRNKIQRVKRWYHDYIPTFVKSWMAIKE